MIEEPVKYITRVEIQGLFGRYDIVWNLHPDVNVLAGINGSGKSTILDAIVEVLSTGKIKTRYYKDKLFDIENVKITANGVSLHGCLIELIRTFDTELNLYDADIKKRSDIQVKTELDLRLLDLQREYMKYRIRIYKNDSEINRTTHTRFLAIIKELFSETQKKVNPDKEELEFLLGDKEINAYQLSSGEKQLLIILLTVLVQDNKPAILLMDEPEISLHIEWQQKLVKYIRELNPNVQIILATHSPDIITDGLLDKVFNISDLIVKDNATA